MEGAEFVAHYERFYECGDTGLAQWRSLTGDIKASHVIEAWTSAAGSQGPTVIDIGCGDGAVSQALISSGFAQKVAGVEISAAAVAAANARRLPNASFSVMSPSKVPYRDGEFDLAILSHVIEHVEDPRGLIREASRVAEYVFIEVPLERTLRLPRDFAWSDTGHINFYDGQLFRYLLQSMGYRIHFEGTWPPRRAVYSFRHGRLRGNIKWLVTSCLRWLLGRHAEALVVHQGGLLVTPAEGAVPRHEGAAAKR